MTLLSSISSKSRFCGYYTTVNLSLRHSLFYFALMAVFSHCYHQADILFKHLSIPISEFQPSPNVLTYASSFFPDVTHGHKILRRFLLTFGKNMTMCYRCSENSIKLWYHQEFDFYIKARFRPIIEVSCQQPVVTRY